MPRSFKHYIRLVSVVLKKITFIALVVILGIGCFFIFNVKYIRIGIILDIRQNAIVLKGSGPYDPSYILPVEEKSRFYNSNGDEITLSKLKIGDRVKVKLFPRSYGGIFLVRQQKTIRWLKILSE